MEIKIHNTMTRKNLNLNGIQEFISFCSNNSNLSQVIDSYNYDSFIIRCKNGSKIHIKKKNRGKFTQYCGGNVTEECIKRGKNSPNPAIRKRATFAQNARKFKH